MVLAVAYVQTRRENNPRGAWAPWYEGQDIICKAFGIYKNKEDRPSREEIPDEGYPDREEKADLASQGASEGADAQNS